MAIPTEMRLDRTFYRWLHRYMKQTDPSSHLAVTARNNLQQNIVFEWIVRKWNDFNIPDMDTIANLIVLATWTNQHARVHRLEEIGNTTLLLKVMQTYMKKMLQDTGKSLRYPHALPLSRLLSYCLDNLCFFDFHLWLNVNNVTTTERNRVQRLARCTNQEMFQLLVIFGIAVDDWSLVRHGIKVCGVSKHFKTQLQISYSRYMDRYQIHGWYNMMRMRSIDKCEREMLAKISADLGEWDFVEDYLNDNPTEAFINFVVLKLLDDDDPDWESVQTLIPKCSNYSSLLTVFSNAIIEWEFQDAKMILHLLREDSGSPAIFFHFIVELLSGEHEHNSVVRLLKYCAKYGMTTHWDFTSVHRPLPMFSQDPSDLTTLAVCIGLVSYRDCFEHLQQFGSPDNSQRQQILHDLQTQGTRPLLEVCQLTLSHRMGFLPGREQRIDELELPGKVKAMLSFKTFKYNASFT